MMSFPVIFRAQITMTKTEVYLWERIGILERAMTQLLKTELESVPQGSVLSERMLKIEHIHQTTLEDAQVADAEYMSKINNEEE